jgi:hypothetical protein
MTRSRLLKIGSVLGSVAAVVLCGPIILGWLADAAGPPFAYPFDDRKFDQKLWARASAEAQDNPRGRMVVDLLDRYLKPGMPEAAVERLLGAPSSTQTPEYFALKTTGTIWCYSIGAWSGFRMDGDGLAVHFDTKGKLVRAWCYQS